MATGKYDHLDRDQAIALLEKRDRTKPVGLRWERRELELDQALNGDFVACDLRLDLSDGPHPWENLIIEGDNFDALRWLRMTMAGRVKCIYIDPPYNTGNVTWVYNDRMVDPNDRYRQSLWLEFLYARLTLAEHLLTDDGVILVSINDENRARLELMMDEALPGMRVGSLVWRSRIGGDASGHFLSTNHEHVLVYAKPGFAFGGADKSFAKYIYDDGDGRGVYRLSDLSQPKDRIERPNGYYPLQDPETGIWYPCSDKRVWAHPTKERLKKGQRIRKQPIEDLIQDSRIVFPAGERVETWATKAELLEAIRNKDVPWRSNSPALHEDTPDLDFWVGKPVGWGSPYAKRFKAELTNQSQPLGTWIRYSKDDHEVEEDVREIAGKTTKEGTDALNKLFSEKVFNYPKPPTLIRELVGQCTDTDDIVVDFFAGSGTTAQAVMELNEQDAGSRRWVLVSNTEATDKEPEKNICRDVCAERIRRINASDEQGFKTLYAPFGYLRCRPIPNEDLDYDLTPTQMWSIILTMEGLPLTPFVEGKGLQAFRLETSAVCLLDTLTQESAEALDRLSHQVRQMRVYTWAPEQVEPSGPAEVDIRILPEAFLTQFQA